MSRQAGQTESEKAAWSCKYRGRVPPIKCFAGLTGVLPNTVETGRTINMPGMRCNDGDAVARPHWHRPMSFITTSVLTEVISDRRMGQTLRIFGVNISRGGYVSNLKKKVPQRREEEVEMIPQQPAAAVCESGTINGHHHRRVMAVMKPNRPDQISLAGLYTATGHNLRRLPDMLYPA